MKSVSTVTLDLAFSSFPRMKWMAAGVGVDWHPRAVTLNPMHGYMGDWGSFRKLPEALGPHAWGRMGYSSCCQERFALSAQGCTGFLPGCLHSSRNCPRELKFEIGHQLCNSVRSCDAMRT